MRTVQTRVKALGRQALRRSLLTIIAHDEYRLENFSIVHGGLTVDLTKTHMTPELVSCAADAWIAGGAAKWVASVSAGEIVNNTEMRAALHTAWRAAQPIETTVRGEPVAALVQQTNAKMKKLVERWRQSDATAILHLGTGGSALGPQLAIEALQPRTNRRFDVRVVGNIDAEAILRAMEGLDPKRTRVIIASKSWTTLETQVNAALVFDWLKAGGVADPNSVTVAVTEKVDLALASGVPEESILEVPAWVGGRFSLWSAVGLPVAMQIGWDQFQALRAGAADMDAHAASAPLALNAPWLSALAGWLYAELGRCRSRAVFAYDERLRLLPEYLSQLEMESLGKGVDREGRLLESSAPVVWGGVGTNAQHAVFQALHQGTDVVPVDFVLCRKPGHNIEASHRHLVANALAQSAVLLKGKTRADAMRELVRQGMSRTEARTLAAHKAFPGNRPSSMIVLDELTPETLGALLAYYENRVVVQAGLWQVNPFDQWGVEMGKIVARQLAEGSGWSDLDPSTQMLANRILGGNSRS